MTTDLRYWNAIRRRVIQSDQETELVGKYLSGDSTAKLAGDYHTVRSVILHTLARLGIPRRSSAHENTKYSVNASVFETGSQEAHYWLGFLLADGCIHKPKNGGALQLAINLGVCRRSATWCKRACYVP
jgi:exopolysaccharide biosynthesis protein